MRASEDKPDLIESFVGRIFGKAVLEDPAPAGMKRMDPEQVPEIYPATTEEWAGEHQLEHLLRPLFVRAVPPALAIVA